jgi:F-type H+-transporting ATPase subunit b
MNLMPVLAAAAEAAASENPFTQVTRQFGWEPRLFFSQLVMFVMVAWVLARYAYKPLLAMLDMRRQQIQESLDNAAKTREELANAQAKAQEIIVQAGQKADKIVEESRAAAQREIEKASQQAIATANQILAKAKEAGESELARMKAELRREVGRLVVQTTAKVTGKILTVEDQQRLADQTNKELAA